MEIPWQEVVDKNHLGVWILDSQDRTIYLNARLAFLLGLPPSALLSRTPAEIFDPQQSLRFLTCLKQSQPGLTDFCFRRRDGKHLYLLCAVNPLHLPNQPSQGTLVMVADISERKLVEELLWRQAHIVDQIHDAVISADLAGCITSWNQSAERLFGHSAAEMLGKPFTVLYPPDQSEVLTQKVITVLKEKGFYELELRLLHGSGNLFFAHLAISPLKDRDGDIIGVIAAIRDITERKIMENELIRTSRLESVSVLASGIAHDFNNLLTAILGNITMANLNADANAFVQERLAEAEKACIRAQNLTRQLLAFSTGEKPQKKLVSLSDLLQTSASLVLRSSNVRRQAEIAPDLWWVEADAEQINQVLIHLLINADQAMPHGGVIRIQAENIRIPEKSQIPLKPGPYVKVSIQDQGVGIPSEYLDKVFDPFFTTKRRGSGLGLATVYTIIKKHDGHITVASTPPDGATFTIYLLASRKKGPLIRPKTLKLSFGQGKILLMDDEEMILEVSSAMLRRLGYEVTVALNGAEAIEYFRLATLTGEPFDAVILDLTVPGGLGAKETIGELRQINPNAKVIVTSGFSDDPLMTDFQQYGFSSFMPKPYNLTQLSAVMHKILK
jgi:two-component system, cell cycle sensor histidine kinase and response regulator CckA